MDAHSKRGTLLIMGAVVIVVVGGMVTMLLSLTTGGAKRETWRTHRSRSREIAEAGVDLSINRLRHATDGVDNNGDGTIDEGVDAFEGPFGHFPLNEASGLEGQLGRIGTSTWTSSDDADGNGWPDFDEARVIPISFSGGELFAYTLFSEDDGIDNDNDGETDEEDEAGSLTALARGRYNGTVSTVMYSGLFTDTLAPPDPPEWVPGGALSSGGDVLVQGNADVFGDYGNVHSNQDLTMRGAPTVEGTVSASGNLSVDDPSQTGGLGYNANPIPIPMVNPEDFRGRADYILKADGSVVDGQSGAVLAASVGGGGWHGWKNQGGRWQLSSRSADLDGTFFVEGDAKIATIGGGSDSTNNVTIIATGDIEFAGRSTFSPDLEDLWLVSGGDIKLTGTVEQVNPGIILAREQIWVSGTAEINGAMMAADLDNQSASTVNVTKITGNMEITCDEELDSDIPIIVDTHKLILNPAFAAYEER